MLAYFKKKKKNYDPSVFCVFVSLLKVENRNYVLSIIVKSRESQFMKRFLCLAKKFRLHPEGYEKRPLETLVMLIYAFWKDYSESKIGEWISETKGMDGEGSTLEPARSLRKQLPWSR